MSISKRVWLIRHGEAEHNKLAETVSRNAARSLSDPGLTPLGRAQAQQVLADPLLKDALSSGVGRAELIVVSPLLRTLQTAMEAFGSTELKMVAHPDLQETNPVPCDCLRPVSAAAREFPAVHFNEAGLPPLVEWHVKRYAESDGGTVMPLWPENPMDSSDTEESQRIDRASASRWDRFSVWLAERREQHVIVVAHHNVFKKALGICFKNCQVMEFAFAADLHWTLVHGEPAAPPDHKCPIIVENIGPRRPAVLALGTTNPGKVQAAKSGLETYPGFGLQAIGVKVTSGVSDQPSTLQETVQGAKNRAERAAACVQGGCRLSMGLESGLFHIDDSFYDVCVCSVYDGQYHHLGFSCAWQLPPSLAMAIQEGEDMARACNSIGLCNDPSLGEKEGAIGVLSGGRVTRQAYSEQAVKMALLACNPAWYNVAFTSASINAFRPPPHHKTWIFLVAASVLLGTAGAVWRKCSRF